MSTRMTFKQDLERAIVADKLQDFGTLRAQYGQHNVRFSLSDGSFIIAHTASWHYNDTYQEQIEAQLEALKNIERDLATLLAKENDG